MASHSENEDLPFLYDQKIQFFFKSSFETLQWPEHKMFGKKGRKEVSMSLVLSMRPYAHILWNYAKKRGHLISMHFSLKTFMHFQQNHTKSIRHVHEVIVMYITRATTSKLVKSTCISYNLTHSQVTLLSSTNITRMNKSTFWHNQSQTITHDPL